MKAQINFGIWLLLLLGQANLFPEPLIAASTPPLSAHPSIVIQEQKQARIGRYILAVDTIWIQQGGLKVSLSLFLANAPAKPMSGGYKQGEAIIAGSSANPEFTYYLQEIKKYGKGGPPGFVRLSRQPTEKKAPQQVKDEVVLAVDKVARIGDFELRLHQIKSKPVLEFTAVFTRPIYSESSKSGRFDLVEGEMLWVGVAAYYLDKIVGADKVKPGFIVFKRVQHYLPCEEFSPGKHLAGELINNPPWVKAHYVIQMMPIPLCLKGRDRYNLKKRPQTKSAICLLLYYADRNSTQMTLAKRRKLLRTGNIIKIFINEAEARDYARKNQIQAVEL